MRYLLVIDRDGNVMLVDSNAEGNLRMPIGRPLQADDDARVTSAAWSPAGDWTAWSVDSADPDGLHEIRLHEEETDRSSVLAEGASAFYLNPSPCGRWLSHLSPGPLGLELAVSEILNGNLQILERGQPLFWSWEPNSGSLAVHVEDRVMVADLDGSPARMIADGVGPFVVPWWLPGRSVAFVNGGRIVAAALDDPATTDRASVSTLVDGPTTGRFSPDPEGRRIAHITGEGDDLRLVVVDLLSGAHKIITTDPVGAFFWSADGGALAALTGAPGGGARWVVSDGTDVRSLPPFQPSRTWLATVLPFFEQYAQSHFHWSADGTRLVAPAVDDGGHDGALIQSITPPFESRWIADAALAWWA